MPWRYFISVGQFQSNFVDLFDCLEHTDLTHDIFRCILSMIENAQCWWSAADENRVWEESLFLILDDCLYSCEPFSTLFSGLTSIPLYSSQGETYIYNQCGPVFLNHDSWYSFLYFSFPQIDRIYLLQVTTHLIPCSVASPASPALPVLEWTSLSHDSMWPHFLAQYWLLPSWPHTLERLERG